MAKLKRKKKLKDVTGDGKFTFADVLKMRGVKPKKSMGHGGGVYVPRPRMAPMEMRRIDVAGNPASARRFQKDFQDQVFDMFDAADMGLRSKPTRADIDAIDRIPNRSKEMALVDREYVGGFKEQPFIERKEDILRERDLRGLMDPMRLDLPEDMAPMRSRKPGEIMGYGGKVKLMKKGGEVEYGLGGAVLAGINAIKNKEGLIGGIKNVAKAYATPGSGFAQGAKLAGGMLANSNNPALAGIGKVAGMAGNFMPGGAGVAGLAGNVMQNMGGGSGIASVMQPLQGLFKQRYGGYVSPKHRLLRG